MRKAFSRKILSILLYFAGVLLIIFLIIYFFVGFTIVPLSIRFNPFDAINVVQMDKHIKERYSSEIYPNASIIISSELSAVEKISDPREKLNTIFRWEMSDWHNPEWEPDAFYYSSIYPIYLSYKQNNSRLLPQRTYELSIFTPRNPSGQYYGDDPYWLAYNKVGACRELSFLFSYMAKESGLKPRLINTAWHQWVEVDIDNDTYYYDPWCSGQYDFYNSTNGNFTFSYKWFNRTEYFEENCRPISIPCWYNDGIPNPTPSIPYALNYFRTYHELVW